ncbi:replicative DNA helicase [Lelliottia wanjuensis]|uniref:replicative DNA helicase n=1 Tax=Lelliottia wanjuensis TaxID=3050585 RepID=UPI00254DFA57|nr:DnaB-like helicase C-terminal domain-containing protein [Lelliottia sp. V104_15]MDK9607082.1 DnaB-like helicase C-terminal domain-containing protein [Lelliottia sp. V104_15]
MIQELEASVIGGLLIGGLTPDADDVLSTLEAEAFAIPVYRAIFTEIKRQAKTRYLIDPMLVAEAIGDAHFADVMETYRACPSAANLKGYAGQVHANYERRKILEIIGDTHSRIANGTIGIAETAIDEMMTRITAARTQRDEIIPVHVSELLDAYTEKLDDRLRNGEESDTLKTGVHGLDRLTGGLNPDDLVVLAGRPGMGKTELALSIAQGVAKQRASEEHRRGVLVFSMEMSAQQLIERQIADGGNIPVSALRNPAKMGDEEWARVAMGIGDLTGIDTWIVDASRLSVDKIRSIATRHKQRHPGLSLIVIDYLTLMELPKAERHDLAVGHITGTLKRTAKAIHTPVLLLSQLSRDVEKRVNKRPTNSDLRDSGSVEQDADIIVMVYRDAVYNEQSPAAPYAEIIVTKNRSGSLGTVYKRFVNGHFKPCDQDEARNACSASAGPQKQPKRYARGAEV